MTEKQTRMWGILACLDGEEVLRMLTEQHGLQLLDDGFYSKLVDKGYIFDWEQIKETEEEEEEYSCSTGMNDCNICPSDGVCLRQGTEEMKRAKQAETFEDFCNSFDGCTYCPFDGELEDCETVLWPKWKAKQPRQNTIA